MHVRSLGAQLALPRSSLRHEQPQSRPRSTRGQAQKGARVEEAGSPGLPLHPGLQKSRPVPEVRKSAISPTVAFQVRLTDERELLLQIGFRGRQVSHRGSGDLDAERALPNQARFLHQRSQAGGQRGQGPRPQVRGEFVILFGCFGYRLDTNLLDIMFVLCI